MGRPQRHDRGGNPPFTPPGDQFPVPPYPGQPGPGCGRLLYFQTGSEMKSGAGLEAGTEGADDENCPGWREGLLASRGGAQKGAGRLLSSLPTPGQGFSEVRAVGEGLPANGVQGPQTPVIPQSRAPSSPGHSSSAPPPPFLVLRNPDSHPRPGLPPPPDPP